MRIAERVNIALRAVDPSGSVEAQDETTGLEVAVATGHHAPIVRLLQQGGKPADFELCAAANYEVGLSDPRDQAGSCLDVMRILQRGSGGIGLDEITADLLCQRRPLGLTGEYPDLGADDGRREQA